MPTQVQISLENASEAVRARIDNAIAQLAELMSDSSDLDQVDQAHVMHAILIEAMLAGGVNYFQACNRTWQHSGEELMPDYWLKLFDRCWQQAVRLCDDGELPEWLRENRELLR